MGCSVSSNKSKLINVKPCNKIQNFSGTVTRQQLEPSVVCLSRQKEDCPRRKIRGGGTRAATVASSAVDPVAGGRPYSTATRPRNDSGSVQSLNSSQKDSNKIIDRENSWASRTLHDSTPWIPTPSSLTPHKQTRQFASQGHLQIFRYSTFESRPRSFEDRFITIELQLDSELLENTPLSCSSPSSHRNDDLASLSYKGSTKTEDLEKLDYVLPKHEFDPRFFHSLEDNKMDSRSKNIITNYEDKISVKNEQKDEDDILFEQTNLEKDSTDKSTCQNEVDSKENKQVGLMTLEKETDKQEACDREEKSQESPEVCKPLENMVIHQNSDINIDLGASRENESVSSAANADGFNPVGRDVTITSSPEANGCMMEECDPSTRLTALDDNTSTSIAISNQDYTEPAYLQNSHQLVLPLRNTRPTDDEESESDGDSAYSYESDYFPLDEVDLQPVKAVHHQMSFDKLPLLDVNSVPLLGANSGPFANIVFSGKSQESGSSLQNDLMTGVMLQRDVQLVESLSSREGDHAATSNECFIVSSWGADDYKLERSHKNRSVRGSLSTVGGACQMRKDDSTNSLSSQRSQDLKWPVHHVHMDFFNDFGDCFDEEGDFGRT
ncbi:uncharacterized protein [Antedon mediterranea]|uniref:uncharacterized protein n=1 Tax=Antedon mediterranea TaxID=105859 RepID=UPI003AF53DB2